MAQLGERLYLVPRGKAKWFRARERNRPSWVSQGGVSLFQMVFTASRLEELEGSQGKELSPLILGDLRMDILL